MHQAGTRLLVARAPSLIGLLQSFEPSINPRADSAGSGQEALLEYGTSRALGNGG